MGEVIFHVSNTLGAERRGELKNVLEKTRGVKKVSFTDGRPHLVIVNYDPSSLRAFDMLGRFRNEGVSAQIAGF